MDVMRERIDLCAAPYSQVVGKISLKFKNTSEVIKSIISIKNSQVNVINKLKDKNGNMTTDPATMALLSLMIFSSM